MTVCFKSLNCPVKLSAHFSLHFDFSYFDDEGKGEPLEGHHLNDCVGKSEGELEGREHVIDCWGSIAGACTAVVFHCSAALARGQAGGLDSTRRFITAAL